MRRKRGDILTRLEQLEEACFREPVLIQWYLPETDEHKVMTVQEAIQVDPTLLKTCIFEKIISGNDNDDIWALLEARHKFAESIDFDDPESEYFIPKPQNEDNFLN